ncbi:Phage integrase [Paramagnetospirillum magnetotacticum MS-1]|uniref:Phage integrase n=1 Tax=Paramagnetospirillum magnetotacticum MS-1 TaxID=272627 RepID=A0A0C2Z1D6_PARME|nr:Phage integrase [Paramagnetospirillum magnetotacticum MS-1]
MSEAAALYIGAKKKGRPKTFRQGVDRVVSQMIAVAGDKPIDTFSREEANALRNSLREKGLSTPSIKRAFSVVRALINFVSRELGLDEIRTFSSIYFGEENDDPRAKRSSFGSAELQAIQAACRNLDDEPRWLIGLISDSGMRLAEATGLTKDDVVLDGEFPHVNLRPHPWRPLKTQSSSRIVPLIGLSLWAAQRAVSASSSAFLFPKYCNENECKSNSASAALNKWMSPRVPKGCVVHSFRHSLRDRLRAVECPRDIVDRLGGWTLEGIGETYGKGYPVHVLHKWMEAIV